MTLVVSERRRAAHRANARRSTGPTSERGKQRSARNAVTHGLSAARITLDGPERARLSRRIRAWSDDLRPRDELETALVARMARASILVERVGRLDDAAWREAVRSAIERGDDPSLACPDGPALRLVIRHAPRWRRALRLALAAFHVLRRARPESQNEANARAAQVVARLDRMFDRRPAVAHAGRAGRARRAVAAPVSDAGGERAVDPVESRPVLQDEATAIASRLVAVDEVASRPAATPAHARPTPAPAPAPRGAANATAPMRADIAQGATPFFPNEATGSALRARERQGLAARLAARLAHAVGSHRGSAGVGREEEGGRSGVGTTAGRRAYREAG